MNHRAQCAGDRVARAAAVGGRRQRSGEPAAVQCRSGNPGTAAAGVLYGDRVDQIDLRIGKILRFRCAAESGAA
jgi:hypothetical protein